MKCKIELVLCSLLCLLKQLRMKMTLGMHCVKKMKELTSYVQLQQAVPVVRLILATTVSYFEAIILFYD